MLQENSDLQDLNVLHEGKELPKPNLRKFSEAEEDEFFLKIYEFNENGQDDEADKLVVQLPISAGILNVVKRREGIEYILEHGMNVSKAVEKYGEKWLEK